jgi:TetR/AcrR family transcriptional repressor of nem operon
MVAMEKLDTRRNILLLAQDLIQRRGYNAFSYQDLSDELKIKKASIHHHFPSKEDLGAEVLEVALQRFREWTKSLSPDLTPAEKINQYIDAANVWAKRCDKICLGGITMAEWNTLPKKMKTMAELLQRERRAWVIATQDAGQKSGDFKRSSSPEHLALMVWSSIQGALQITRAQEDPKVFEIVAKQIKEMIKK